MSKVLIDREVLESAFDAINNHLWGGIATEIQEIEKARTELRAALEQPGVEPHDHGPQAETVDEALRDVSKWLNERPNRPLDLRHVSMLCHALSAPQPAQQPDTRSTAIQACINCLIQGGQHAAAQMLRHHFAKDLGEE